MAFNHRSTMKLYDLEKGSKIYCEVSDGSTYVIFDHIDGLYSYCTSEKGAIIHLSAVAPLKEMKDGYEIEIEE